MQKFIHCFPIKLCYIKNNMGMPPSKNEYITHSNTSLLLITNRKNITYEIIIDSEDLQLVKKYNWSARKDSSHGLLVIKCQIYENNKKTYKNLHQILMGKKEGQVIDHIDGDRKNNTKSNLRFVSLRENSINRKVRCNTTRGITFSKKDKVYVAQITYNGKLIYLGSYKCPLQCAEVYYRKFKELNGYDHPKNKRHYKE